MADVTKDSFNAAYNFTKVIFQRGRDICDFELNESQDNLRYIMYRGLNGSATLPSQRCGANGDGAKVYLTSSPSDTLRIGAGSVFFEGIVYDESGGGGLSVTPNSSGSPRTDVVYVSVHEVETTDPASVPQLGETTRRLQLQLQYYYQSGTTTIPTDTAASVIGGGTHYYKLAEVTVAAGASTVTSADIIDFRQTLPASILNTITTQTVNRVTGARKIVMSPGLNWTITCGDGYQTWGDYNGPSALEAALSAAASIGFSGNVNIVLKTGDYNLTSSATTPYANVRITGEVCDVVGSYGARILVGPPATPGTSTVTFNCLSLTIENLKFERNVTTASDRQITFNQDGIVRCVNSSFYGVGPVVATSTHPRSLVKFDQCVFDQRTSSTAMNIPCVTFQTDTGAPQVVFDDCKFYAAAQNNPAIRVKVETTLTWSCLHKGYTFNNCEFRLGYTALRTVSSGIYSLTANCGVVEIDPTNSTDTYCMVVDKLVFNDCDVYANSLSQTSVCSILLYLTPTGLGGTGKLNLSSLIIRGGKWVCPLVASGMAPFQYISSAIADTEAEMDLISGTRFMWGTPDVFGDTTASPFGVAYICNKVENALTNSTITASSLYHWGAFVFMARRPLSIENCKFSHLPAVSSQGDLVLCPTSTGYIALTNTTLTYMEPSGGAGTGVGPYQRVRVTNPHADTRGVRMKNVQILETTGKIWLGKDLAGAPQYYGVLRIDQNDGADMGSIFEGVVIESYSANNLSTSSSDAYANIMFRDYGVDGPKSWGRLKFYDCTLVNLNGEVDQHANIVVQPDPTAHTGGTNYAVFSENTFERCRIYGDGSKSASGFVAAGIGMYFRNNFSYNILGPFGAVAFELVFNTSDIIRRQNNWIGNISTSAGGGAHSAIHFWIGMYSSTDTGFTELGVFRDNMLGSPGHAYDETGRLVLQGRWFSGTSVPHQDGMQEGPLYGCQVCTVPMTGGATALYMYNKDTFMECNQGVVSWLGNGS